MRDIALAKAYNAKMCKRNMYKRQEANVYGSSWVNGGAYYNYRASKPNVLKVKQTIYGGQEVQPVY